LVLQWSWGGMSRAQQSPTWEIPLSASPAAFREALGGTGPHGTGETGGTPNLEGAIEAFIAYYLVPTALLLQVP